MKKKRYIEKMFGGGVKPDRHKKKQLEKEKQKYKN